ncbi:MAG TPA: DUF362 domain-containing protein [Pyrinomonadaceae bacterium]|jgi:uncharacterized protein (DUF362 family)
MVKVAVTTTEQAEYPKQAPFHPAESFPEYPFAGETARGKNFVYSAVRQLFVELGYDAENFGKKEWNPLGWLIKPEMTVVLKPNFVRSRHYEKKDPFAIITHPAVLRAVADYVWIALKGEGKIIIADAPQYDCNWTELMELTRLETVRDFYNLRRPASFELRDLRPYWSRRKHFPSMLMPLEGDPQGTLNVNLGRESALTAIKNPNRLYGAVYHRQETIANHTGDNQAYALSRTIMDADVVISVPKLKTHKKVGVTMNIKGLVGINTNKNLIVHYCVGSPAEGGDQYPPNHFTPTEERLIKTERWMYDTFLARRSVPLEYLHRSIYWLHGRFIKPFGIKVEKEKRLLDAGNWHGNDSAWRMSADLLKILLFADKEGKLQINQQRRLFSVIDGIIGGDNKGPLDPDPVASGVLLASENFLAADIVGARLMGFDPMLIRTFVYLMNEPNFDYGVREFKDMEIKTSVAEWRDCLSNKTDRFLNYRPYPGWIGHLEISGNNNGHGKL